MWDLTIASEYVHRDPVDTGDFADLTPTPCLAVEWGPAGLVLTFDSQLSAAEVKAVRARVASRDIAEEDLKRQASDVGLATNVAFLSMTAPRTAAQIEAQVEALTRQASGFIQLNTAGDD
jgi:hypothetical protein